MKAQLPDLDNPAAAAGSVEVVLSVDAFQKWMQRCRYTRATANVNQEVYFIHTGSPRQIGHHLVTPNWHITAMTTYRGGGDCKNFDFKVEIGKAASHYWHYVVHYVPASGQFVWVGASNPKLPQTNQGGGGAAGNAQLLKANLDETERVARAHGIDGRVTRRTQASMLRVLKGMVDGGQLIHAGGRIDTR